MEAWMFSPSRPSSKSSSSMESWGGCCYSSSMCLIFHRILTCFFINMLFMEGCHEIFNDHFIFILLMMRKPMLENTSHKTISEEISFSPIFSYHFNALSSRVHGKVTIIISSWAIWEFSTTPINDIICNKHESWYP